MGKTVEKSQLFPFSYFMIGTYVFGHLAWEHGIKFDNLVVCIHLGKMLLTNGPNKTQTQNI